MSIFLIWAYQDTIDAKQSLNAFHNQNRGYQLVTLIPAETRRPQTRTYVSSTAAGAVTSIVTPTPRKETMKSSSVMTATPRKEEITSLSIETLTPTMAPSLTSTSSPAQTTGAMFFVSFRFFFFCLSVFLLLSLIASLSISNLGDLQKIWC